MSTPGGLVDKQELIDAQLDTAHLGRVINSKDASGAPISTSTNRTEFETQRDEFDATFQAQFAYKRIGNISDYVGQQLPEADKLNSYQYPDDSGEWYGPVQSQSFPIAIPADPSTSSGWALVNALTTDTLGFYTNIVRKASIDKSPVENMIEESKVGEISKCENGSEFKRVVNTSGDINDFTPLNVSSFISDYGVVGDGSESDKAKVILAISFSAAFKKQLIIDVGGVYNPIFLVDDSHVHVTKTLTLKGNPNTTPQGIMDCLFTTSCTGFSLTFDEGLTHTSESHGTWQEFSHFIRCQNAYKGYIGPSRCDKFDGDGIFWSQSADVTIDRNVSLRPGRSGISIIENLERCTLNAPHCQGIHPDPLADSLGCLNIEPNKAGNLDVTINNPSGFGDSVRSTGLQVFLEKFQVNDSNFERYIVNIQINNPSYNRCKNDYNFKNFFWKDNAGAIVSPKGSISVVDPIITNPKDKGINIDSVLRNGGIELNIVRPMLNLTLPSDGTDSSQSNNMIVVTRNQNTFMDPDSPSCVNITDISINDTSNYTHDSYLFCRYGEGFNLITFDKVLNRAPSTPLIVLPESGAGTTNSGVIRANAREVVNITTSQTLEIESCLHTITNLGASSEITLTLPVIPFNLEFEIANTLDNNPLNVQPPSGRGIGSEPINQPYVLTAADRYRSTKFKRVDSNRYLVS